MLGDNKRILCTWSYGHGGKSGLMAKSEDGGLSWKKLKHLKIGIQSQKR